jgi:6-phosphogluconolactonase
MSNTLPMPHIEILPTLDDFAIAASRAIVAAITNALHDREKCLIALSGGRTPRGVYRHVANLLVAQSVDLREVQVLFVDERMVHPDDPESNFRMVQQEFIARVALPPSHIHRIRGELNPETAAAEYEREVDTLLSNFNGRCDLIVLGVGEDGHTASLFPDTHVLHEYQRNVRAVYVPRLESWRVTLTLPVINRSRAVMFLATGEEKAVIVGTILRTTSAHEDIPATLVHLDSGTITWMLDAKAASNIPTHVSPPGRAANDTFPTE